MRSRWIVAVLVGLVLVGGIGVAVAQLGGNDEEPLEAESSDTAPATTTTAPETTTAPPETTTEAGGEATTTRRRAATTTVTRTTTAANAGVTATSRSFPPAAPAPTYPFYPEPTNPFLPQPTDPFQPQSSVVQPRPGMAGLHRTPWDRAEVTGGSSVRIHFVSGVAPCTVLDHVDVDYRANAIVVTLWEGSDPASQNQACIMIAQYKAVDITLSQPINGRPFVDGAS